MSDSVPSARAAASWLRSRGSRGQDLGVKKQCVATEADDAIGSASVDVRRWTRGNGLGDRPSCSATYERARCPLGTGEARAPTPRPSSAVGSVPSTTPPSKRRSAGQDQREQDAETSDGEQFVCRRYSSRGVRCGQRGIGRGGRGAFPRWGRARRRVVRRRWPPRRADACSEAAGGLDAAIGAPCRSIETHTSEVCHERPPALPRGSPGCAGEEWLRARIDPDPWAVVTASVYPREARNCTASTLA